MSTPALSSASVRQIDPDQFDALAEILRAYVDRPKLVAGQHPTEYGHIALRYILSVDALIFGCFSTVELDAVHHAARYAVTSRDMDPHAVERIARLSLDIAEILTRRGQEVERLAADQAGSQPAPPAPAINHYTDRDKGGETEPLHPRPKTNPPAPAMAVPEWSF